MQQVGDLYCFVVKLFLLVADVFDASADDAVDLAHVFFEFGLVSKTNLATDYNAVRCGKCFCGNACLRLFAQEGIENSIRDTVADLVWVALRNGF